MQISDEQVKRAATEFLSHKGENPYRVTRRGAELWEDYAPAMCAALSALSLPVQPVAWRDVIAERKRQVEAEGWTPEHDDAHDRDQLARAAACYAAWNRDSTLLSLLWPWWERDDEHGETHIAWWKPTSRRADLVKAGALILAEIERLDRASSTITTPPVQPTKGPEDDLIAAAQAFVDKIEMCHADPRYAAVWTVAHLHIGAYTGPMYKLELEKLQHVLALRSRPASALPVVDRAAIVEECARIAEGKYTNETVRKNRKGNPYPWGAAAIFAGREIAKAIRSALTPSVQP